MSHPCDLSHFSSLPRDILLEVVSGLPISTALALYSVNKPHLKLFARSDHGLQNAGNLHAVVTASTHGFMSSSDKTKLDASTSSSSVGTIVQRNENGGSNFASVGIVSDGALQLFDNTNTFSTSVMPASNLSQNLVFRLPSDYGASGQVLQTDGSGIFSWAPSTVIPSTNVYVVDKQGSDSLGTASGYPYLTISAALATATNGSIVLVHPGIYEESITVPAGVTLVGQGGVKIRRSNVVSATDLVTLSPSCTISKVALELTSSALVQLRGIVAPSTSASTASLFNVQLSVDNSSAGNGSSTITGIEITGTGSSTTYLLKSCSVSVNSAGSGNKRGVLLSGSATCRVRDCDIFSTTSGTGSAIAAETTGGVLVLLGCIINGKSADISQTAGSLNAYNHQYVNRQKVRCHLISRNVGS